MPSKSYFFIVLSLLAYAQCDYSPRTVCDFCEVSSATIEASLASLMSKEDILSNLRTWCTNLAQWSGVDVAQECQGFVTIYADYLIEMVASSTQNGRLLENACNSFGLCSSNPGEDYVILFPVVNDDNVTYDVSTAQPASSFKFKLFAGNATELFGSESASLTFMISAFDGQMTMQVTNDKGLKDVVQCRADEPLDCAITIISPGSGLWYFVDITVDQPSKVHFNATEKKYVSPMSIFTVSRRHGLSLISFLLLISTFGAVLCLCISCCLRLKNGKLQRSRTCKREMQNEHPEVMEAAVAIPMDMINQTEMDYPLVGYYYYPEQGVWSPAYVELQPQPPQPLPQAPPHTDE